LLRLKTLEAEHELFQFRELLGESTDDLKNIPLQAVELAQEHLNKKNISYNFNSSDPNSQYHQFDLNFEKEISILTKFANGADVRSMNLIAFNVKRDELEALRDKQNAGK
jgi:hypothetical protein